DFGGKRSGAISAYRIEEGTGKLVLLNQQPSGGADPCHLVVDATGRWVLAANYTGGSVVALPVATDGRLAGPRAVIQHHGSGVNASRQSGPHAHFITPDPGNRFVLACDLGLDKVLVYRLRGEPEPLVANDPPGAPLAPGAGPRHL